VIGHGVHGAALGGRRVGRSVARGWAKKKPPNRHIHLSVWRFATGSWQNDSLTANMAAWMK
jgi:hypothetical protein